MLDDATKVDLVKKKLLNYQWRKITLFFKNLVVLKFRERKALVKDIH